jgi:AraC-like DNA-binding protein
MHGMLYLEHRPDPPLSRFVQILWYARGAELDHRRQRILPTGRSQLVISLSRDFLLDCPEGLPDERKAPALLVGQRSVYEIMDTSDLADLIGVVFQPAALPVFTADRADLFSNRSVALDQLWDGQVRMVRDALREISFPQQKLRTLENFLLINFRQRMEHGRFSVHPAVEFALRRFRQTPAVATVSGMAKDTGWSERRFSQVFREQVGFGPKVWCRIQRFQRALWQMQACLEIPWAELAVECGFYDQAHLANEFRAFSGIDASTYTATRDRLWQNHVRVD